MFTQFKLSFLIVNYLARKVQHLKYYFLIWYHLLNNIFLILIFYQFYITRIHFLFQIRFLVWSHTLRPHSTYMYNKVIYFFYYNITLSLEFNLIIIWPGIELNSLNSLVLRNPPVQLLYWCQTRKITHHALLRTAPYSSCHKKAR